MTTAGKSLFIVFLTSLFISINWDGVFAQSVSNTVNESNDGQPKQQTPSQSERKAENPIRAFLSRTSNGGLRPPNSNKNRDLSSVLDAINSGNWDQFTPAPVTEPNCFVEFQIVKRFPGKCTTLGNGVPACQAERWLSLNANECS